MTRIAFIGGGVMGEAMLSAALDAGIFDAGSVSVCEIIEAKREALVGKYRIHATGSVAEALEGANVVILAVKPQEVRKVGIGSLPTGSLLISILAGTTVTTLKDAFSHDAVIRVMPNTPVASREGMSAWYATSAVSPEQLVFTRGLLSSFGRQVQVDDEKKIDMATALSGSGPAYVYLVLEAMIEGGVSIGLTRAQAEELSLQTILGSAKYALDTGRQAADLRAAVTSPAGTTAAGLLAMERGALRATIIDGIRAAHQRAIELGQA